MAVMHLFLLVQWTLKIWSNKVVKHGQRFRTCYIAMINFFCSVCPYFLSRKMAKSADLIFMPYNYIIDRKVCVCVVFMCIVFMCVSGWVGV